LPSSIPEPADFPDPVRPIGIPAEISFLVQHWYDDGASSISIKIVFILVPMVAFHFISLYSERPEPAALADSGSALHAPPQQESMPRKNAAPSSGEPAVTIETTNADIPAGSSSTARQCPMQPQQLEMPFTLVLNADSPSRIGPGGVTQTHLNFPSDRDVIAC
jgi:hypothetical protein